MQYQSDYVYRFVSVDNFKPVAFLFQPLENAAAFVRNIERGVIISLVIILKFFEDMVRCDNEFSRAGINEPDGSQFIRSSSAELGLLSASIYAAQACFITWWLAFCTRRRSSSVSGGCLFLAYPVITHTHYM